MRVQFSSVTQSCPTVCDAMDHSTPGLPVHHQFPESTQTHIHWVGDAIQPYHPLSSASPPALNLSQHQGLFKWVSSSHQVAKVLEFQLQHDAIQQSCFLCCPLLCLPSIFPSIRVLSNESALHIRWPKYWSFSFNISPSNEYSGLISFRMDWLDLKALSS